MQYPDYPKRIAENWKGNPFQSNITAAMNIGDNLCILFNNNKYIDYDLNMVENKEDGKQSRVPNDIRTNIKNRFPGLHLSKIDDIVSFYDNETNNAIFFGGGNYVEYDILTKEETGYGIKKGMQAVKSISKRYPYMWKLNIHRI